MILAECIVILSLNFLFLCSFLGFFILQFVLFSEGEIQFVLEIASQDWKIGLVGGKVK